MRANEILLTEAEKKFIKPSKEIIAPATSKATATFPIDPNLANQLVKEIQTNCGWFLNIFKQKKNSYIEVWANLLTGLPRLNLLLQL
jgi:hypothetical protein